MAIDDRNFDSAANDLDRAKSDTNRAANKALGRHHETATTGDVIGEGVGGLSGIAAGAAIGSLGGPVGTIIGAIAGAVGGWWAGRAVSEAASGYTDDDDAYYRQQFETSGDATSADDYDASRPAYQLGHVASRNPDYANRDFDAVESDLRKGWTSDVAARHGEWDAVRDRARAGFERGRERTLTQNAPVSRQDVAVERTSASLADSAANAADRGEDALARGARKTANKLDDLKDRVDGNPASRPGPDATDSDRRL